MAKESLLFIIAVGSCVLASALIETNSTARIVRSNSAARGYKFDPGSKNFNPAVRYDVLKVFDLLLCSCDKCGTTSLYNYIYQAVFHGPWPYKDLPYESNLYTNRWNGVFRAIWKRRGGGYSLNETLSKFKHRFALVRDPRERLISAWKSKAACDEIVGRGKADSRDREVLMQNLFKLASRRPKPCVTLAEFAELLQVIHREGNAWRLDSHFRPQQHVCFGDLPAENWTVAATISDPRLQQGLAQVLGAPPTLAFPHKHASSNVTLRITQETEARLDEVTRAEYRALGLPRPGPRGAAP